MRRRHGRRINILCDQRTARFFLYSGSRASLVWALRRRHTYHAARFVVPASERPTPTTKQSMLLRAYSNQMAERAFRFSNIIH
jgi:hypothetical protein